MGSRALKSVFTNYATHDTLRRILEETIVFLYKLFISQSRLCLSNTRVRNGCHMNQYLLRLLRDAIFNHYTKGVAVHILQS